MTVSQNLTKKIIVLTTIFLMGAVLNTIDIVYLHKSDQFPSLVSIIDYLLLSFYIIAIISLIFALKYLFPLVYQMSVTVIPKENLWVYNYIKYISYFVLIGAIISNVLKLFLLGKSSEWYKNTGFFSLLDGDLELFELLRSIDYILSFLQFNGMLLFEIPLLIILIPIFLASLKIKQSFISSSLLIASVLLILFNLIMALGLILGNIDFFIKNFDFLSSPIFEYFFLSKNFFLDIILPIIIFLWGLAFLLIYLEHQQRVKSYKNHIILLYLLVALVMIFFLEFTFNVNFLKTETGYLINSEKTSIVNYFGVNTMNQLFKRFLLFLFWLPIPITFYNFSTKFKKSSEFNFLFKYISILSLFFFTIASGVSPLSFRMQIPNRIIDFLTITFFYFSIIIIGSDERFKYEYKEILSNLPTLQRFADGMDLKSLVANIIAIYDQIEENLPLIACYNQSEKSNLIIDSVKHFDEIQSYLSLVKEEFQDLFT
ncbi:MAG: hypothetical protein ACXAC7_16420 [Candidatus Hodarchaeales archaeon]|jgi:hypothetical protein